MTAKVKDGVLLCSSKDCENEALYAAVWTDEQGYWCGPCMGDLLIVGKVMGNMTPHFTQRILLSDEIDTLVAGEEEAHD
jgi:hypothetical protein